ncbi:MAG: GNAT family N-acetyltransferase [Roseburia sp.]
MITYKVLSVNDVDLSLFASFDRTQKVTKCWRKINGEWVIKDVPFIDNWSEEEYREGVQYLKNLINSNGYVVGAFFNGQLKGFASVEPAIFGNHAKYMDLSNIHVSQEMRGQGIGKELFRLAKKWAKEHHAEKLYISAHSAVESQAFYRAMGCVEAVEYNKELAEKEPCDCQLECVL